MDHKLYLSDPGIYKKGVHFYHNGSNKLVNDLKILHRLSSFKVPPAWNNVWYASNKKCHIQVHGTYQSVKKQYKRTINSFLFPDIFNLYCLANFFNCSLL